MGMKEQQRQVYRTAKGAQLDMLKLINQNEMTPAVGNASVNARGDKLGPGGKVIRKATGIPDQADVRQVPVKAIETTDKKTSTTKKVDDMDPEGKE